MDSLFLALAAAEAEKFIGATSPNPPVGAAIVKDGRLLALGAHARAGLDHAEIVALKQALTAHGPETIRGATIYVTLEPCNHHGRTPPCTGALIEAGLARVVFGQRDPNRSVAGGGAARLREAGLIVDERPGHEQSRQLLDGFGTRARTGLPWVTLKRALRLTPEGALTMIPENGAKVFTRPESLAAAHLERRASDAIITGRGTVIADNPLFNVRHVQDHPEKRRTIFVLSHSLIALPEAWLAEQNRLGHDVRLVASPRQALEEAARAGALRVLVEAGPRVSDAFEHEGLWNERLTFIHRDAGDVVTRERR